MIDNNEKTGFSIFGYEFKRKPLKDTTISKPLSAQTDEADVGIVVAGQRYGVYYDLSADKSKNDDSLIKLYRDVSQHPEVEQAIDDIINEAIVTDEDSSPVALITDDLDVSQKVKDMIHEEFAHILKLLNFNWTGTDLFRIWYVDGRLFFQKMIDEKNPKKGIQEVRLIESTKIRKVREITKEQDKNSKAEVVKNVNEYYVYSESGLSADNNVDNNTGFKISKDAITYVPSGMLDSSRSKTISYLHKAIKPVNQLRMMEDALVIYRLSRAPERRIFYIDVGNLPRNKAESYLQSVMNNFQNKVVYNPETGEVETKNHHMTMMEDFWLPRREGGRGTEISTLPGGENLGQIEDIIFFQKKLYRSLNVPASRLDSEQQAMVSLGRTSEITRDELKFQKFINKLRKKFSILFMDLLKTQLILKGIVTPQEWKELSQNINVDFIKDSHFSEMKNAELFRERINTLREMDEFVGRYYSKEWIRKNVLMQTEEEIKIIDKQIDAEPEEELELETESVDKSEAPILEESDEEKELNHSQEEIEDSV